MNYIYISLVQFSLLSLFISLFVENTYTSDWFFVNVLTNDSLNFTRFFAYSDLSQAGETYIKSALIYFTVSVLLLIFILFVVICVGIFLTLSETNHRKFLRLHKVCLLILLSTLTILVLISNCNYCWNVCVTIQNDLIFLSGQLPI